MVMGRLIARRSIGNGRAVWARGLVGSEYLIMGFGEGRRAVGLGAVLSSWRGSVKWSCRM